MNVYQLSVIVFSMFVITNVSAFAQSTSDQCISDGQIVPAGTIRGEYTCCSDGIWRKSCN